jgi:hypothetical protein
MRNFFSLRFRAAGNLAEGIPQHSYYPTKCKNLISFILISFISIALSSALTFFYCCCRCMCECSHSIFSAREREGTLMSFDFLPKSALLLRGMFVTMSLSYFMRAVCSPGEAGHKSIGSALSLIPFRFMQVKLILLPIAKEHLVICLVVANTASKIYCFSFNRRIIVRERERKKLIY